mmetsp:Transcript_19160/g.45158  ORF Transcript_19160/g.45158 Transcript_19160/m.45158 type:complete len:225 (+) Transcript_19160:324-998(+)
MRVLEWNELDKNPTPSILYSYIDEHSTAGNQTPIHTPDSELFCLFVCFLLLWHYFFTQDPQAQQQQQQSPQLVLRGSQLVGCADAAAAAEMSLAGAAVGQPTGAGAGARVPFAWTCEQCSDVENTAANLSCANCDTPAGPGRARAQSSARMRIFRARRRVTQAQGTLQHALAPTQPASNFPANPQNKEQHDPPENASALPVSDAAAQGGGGGGCGGGGGGCGGS